jgi:hypothetical protein
MPVEEHEENKGVHGHAPFERGKQTQGVCMGGRVYPSPRGIDDKAPSCSSNAMEQRMQKRRRFKQN